MKFAEIPHFILTAYIKRMNQLAMEIGDDDETTLRVINPDFIYADSKTIEFKDSMVEGETKFTWSGIQHDTWQSNSYLQGPRTSIVTDSGEIVSLYYKDDNGCYQPINMITDGHSFNYNTTKQHDFFNFDHLQDYNKESPELSSVEGEFYTFKIFDIWNNYLRIPDGAQIYMRNDSIFHQWLKRYGPDYLKSEHAIDFLIRNYVNIDKPYIYLGSMYKNNAYDMSLKGTPDNPFQNFIKVMHKRAKLPQNAYHLLYYNIKNFAIDCVPEHQRTEKLNEFFYYYFDIAYNEVYNTQKDIPNLIDPLECNYEYLWDLCSYYGYDLDKITIEDEKIKRNFTKYLPYMLKKRGTYSVMYAIWKTLTANNSNRLNIYERWHKVPLTYTQYGQNYVVQKDDYMDWLHTSFYDQTNYDIGAGEEYYKENFDDSLYPKLGSDFSFDGNKIIHNMNNIDFIIEVYDTDGVRLLPENIGVAYTYISVVPFKGTIVLKDGVNTPLESLEWENQIVNVYKDGIKRLYNKEKDFDADRIVTSFYEHKEVITIPADEWTITHNLNERYVVTSIYDDEGTPIQAKTIQLLDNNSIKVEFYEPLSGTILVCKSDYQYDLGYEITLSTQYRIEMDLTDYPVDEEKILEKNTVDSLYTLWNDFKPITRTPSYNMVLSIKSDLTGNNINNYSSEYIPFLKTHTNYPVNMIEGVYANYMISDEIYVAHWLGTEDVLVDLYDEDFNKIPDSYIDSIKIIDENNLEVRFFNNLFEDPYYYYIFVKKAFQSFSIPTIEENTYRHSNNSSDILINFFNNGNINWPQPNDTKIIDNNIIEMESQLTDSLAIINSEEKAYQEYPSTTWNIQHNLNMKFLLVHTYNEHQERILPTNIKIIDENNIQITFSEDQKGHVLLFSMGNVSFDSNNKDIYFEKYTGQSIEIEHGLYTYDLIVYTYDDYFNVITPDSINFVDSNNISVVFSEEKTFYVCIKESSDIYEYIPPGSLLRQYYHENKKVSPYDNTGDSLFDMELLEEPDDVFTQIVPSDVWEIGHLFNKFGAITDFYDNDNKKIKPSKLTIVDNLNLRAEFDEPMIGKVLLKNMDVNFIRSNITETTINHGLNTTKLFVDVYDTNWEMIYTTNIEIIDVNNIKISNDYPINIYVIVKKQEYEVLSEIEGGSLDTFMKQYYDGSNIIDLHNINDPYSKISLLVPDIEISFEEASTEWTINHNLGRFGVVIDVYNNSDVKLTPTNIKLIDNNTAKVTFNTPQTGKAFVSIFFRKTITERNNCVVYENDDVSHTINHNLNTDRFLIDVYSNSLEQIIPTNVSVIDNNNLQLDIAESDNIFVLIKGIKMDNYEYLRCYPWVIDTSYNNQGILINTLFNDTYKKSDNIFKFDNNNLVIEDDNINKVVVYRNGNYINITEASTEWEIEHNYGGIAIISDFYDEDGKRMFPDSVSLLDGEKSLAKFDEAVKGKVSFSYIGDLSLIEMREKLNNCKFSVSDGETTEIFDIKYIKETRFNFYVHASVPKDITMDITNIKIISWLDEVVFESDCTHIYKDNEFELRLLWDINKKYFKLGEYNG